MPVHLFRKPIESGGFTLLEIMIALAIIGFAVIALLGLTNRSILVHERLARITEATFLAQQTMAETEIKAGQDLFRAEQTEGGFAEPYDAYRWRITFDETPLPAVQKVTVTVLWGDETLNEYVDLTSFVF